MLVCSSSELEPDKKVGKEEGERVVPPPPHLEIVRQVVTMELCCHHRHRMICHAQDSGCVLVIIVIDMG